ncbi:FidL-like protein [Serratia marcescens]|uniref:FidL-like protein n=1 Tax=Serratia marcescens TaxID=615 RepID=UPI00148B74BF|nr:FidL-like protein [Serratia marcescens]QJU42299.1 hypothetical protein HMI62_24645 [Serratia marcescens]
MKVITTATFIAALFIFNAVIYILGEQRKVEFPGVCHYELSHLRKSDKGLLNINAAYTLLKKADKKGEILVEGQVVVEGTSLSYHMNRIMSFNITQENDNGLYFLEFYSVNRKSDDNTPDSLFSLMHANLTTQTLLKVEKVKDNAYLLTTQLTPLPICISG